MTRHTPPHAHEWRKVYKTPNGFVTRAIDEAMERDKKAGE
jgi:hypothetical protein